MALSASQVEYVIGEFDASGTSEKTQTTAPNHFQHTANSKSPGHVVRVTLLASVRAEDLESGQRVLATLVGKVGVWDSETRSF
ncbi:carboxylic acid transporter, partial [Moniliophthora roreri]